VPKDIGSISRVGFLTLDEFTMIAFSSAVEVLRMANHLRGQKIYEWTIMAPGGSPVASSCGLAPIQTKRYREADLPDIVFVCGGTNVEKYVDDGVVKLLRKMAHDGVMLGGLCTGTYALVKSGLLDGYECTIHWENMVGLRETYRRVSFQEELFVVDRDRITCTGGIAPIDMMLAIVKARFGATLVAEISNQFILERVRDSDDRQYIPLAVRMGSGRDTLRKVAELMEANFEEPLTAVELANLAGLSLRQIQRMFHEALGTTPTKYYLRLRLQRARALLIQSTLPITEIAVACGFQSACHFSKSYRAVYGRSPRSERQQPMFGNGTKVPAARRRVAAGQV
jgi:AraC family transcriptional regulator, glycine betaine-responsive activator